MPKPIIALPADIREFDGAVWHATPDQYVRAVLKAADVMPFIISAFVNGNDIDAIIDRVDGLLVSGTATNVNHAVYGREASATHGTSNTRTDERRVGTEWASTVRARRVSE